MKVTAIVPAAGRGERLKRKIDKPFVILGDKPILIHTLRALSKCDFIDEIIVAVNEDNFNLLYKKLSGEKIEKPVRVVRGGLTRQASVYCGLGEVDKITNFVLIHDGVRPFVTPELISKAIKKAIRLGAVVVAVPVCSTIKKIKICRLESANKKKQPIVQSTVDRAGLWEIQTPQVFKKELILKAYQKAREENFEGTDDSSLVERLGQRVSILPGLYSNIKITTPEDLIFAEALLKSRE